MTILTTPSILKKPTSISQNVNVENGNGDDPTLLLPAEDEAGPRRGATGAVFGMAIFGLLVASIGCLSILETYNQLRRNNNMRNINYLRYQGFCSIPVERFNVQPQMRVMPLSFTNSIENMPHSDLDEKITDQADDVRWLREEFYIGDTMERISVMNKDGGQIVFVHDFIANLSGEMKKSTAFLLVHFVKGEENAREKYQGMGSSVSCVINTSLVNPPAERIMDSERCFLMQLDPELVLPPHTLLLTIEGGGQFDVSRVRAAMRALLPAVGGGAGSRQLDYLCRGKPLYRLQTFEELDDDVDDDADGDVDGDADGYHGEKLVRKRSAESAESTRSDFTHFSGHRVQDITVTNLQALRAAEENNRNN